MILFKRMVLLFILILNSSNVISQSTSLIEYSGLPLLFPHRLVLSPNGYLVSFGDVYLQGEWGSLFLQTDPFSGNSNGKFLRFNDSRDLRVPLVETAIATQDGGYAMAGELSEHADVQDVFVLKFRKSGSVEWKMRSPVVDSTSQERIHKILEIQDGFLLIGSVSGQAPLSTQLLLIKLDTSGNVRWKRTLQSVLVPHLGASGFAATNLGQGVVLISGTYQRAFLLVQVNSNGKVLWSRTYDTRYYSRLGNKQTVFQTSDSGFLLAAEVRRPNGENGISVLKTDFFGKALWHRFFTTPGGLLFLGDASKTSDGGLALVGRILYAQSSTAFVAKLDAEGAIKWKGAFDKTDRSEFTAVTGFPDGTIGVSGTRFLSSIFGRLTLTGQVSNVCDLFRSFRLTSTRVPIHVVKTRVKSLAAPSSTENLSVQARDFNVTGTQVCSNR